MRAHVETPDVAPNVVPHWYLYVDGEFVAQTSVPEVARLYVRIVEALRRDDAPYSVLAGGTVTVPYRACELFLTCMRPAVHMVRHPILRDLVPTCTECVERFGLSDRVIPDACA